MDLQSTHFSNAMQPAVQNNKEQQQQEKETRNAISQNSI